jgi:hypothetical protein
MAPNSPTASHHRRFIDHAERDAYLQAFVADYNQTRLRCLGYNALAQLLAKLTGHSTCAGAGLSAPDQVIFAMLLDRLPCLVT